MSSTFDTPASPGFGGRLTIDLDALVAVRAIPGDEMPDEPLFGAIARSGPPRHIDWRARPA